MDRIKEDSPSSIGGVEPKALQRVAVIGGGLIGRGIAATMVLHDLTVTLVESTEELLEQGMERTRRRLARGLASARSGLLTISEATSRIIPTTDLNTLRNGDFVIEAITEKESDKKNLLKRLNEVVGTKCVVGSNTSTISISRLAESMVEPRRFLGMHFFNPIERVRLVEVIRGTKTDDGVVQKTLALAKRLGKTPVVVKDCPGFLVNRLLFPYLNESLLLIEEAASPEAVDRSAKAFGMPMGPITLHYVIGLDTALFAGRVLTAAYPDRMFEPKILALPVEAGRLGQKSGAGFYRYDSDGRTGTLDPSLDAMIAKLGGRPKREFTEEEITNRLFFAMLVEAIHALSEAVVRDPETLDTSLTLGTGFPTARRGILRWADTIGAKTDRRSSKSLRIPGRSLQSTPDVDRIGSQR
jgi:3-hydroxyacyl-CoA dehydrogenase / enoyl-CoA hydratase / 3-hydroxybutyryl-CoA epimerase / enoyl-CoA isomerase